MKFNRDDVSTWPGFKPTIISHDVGRSHDRSTAVVGGPGAFNIGLIGVEQAIELPLGLSGSPLASALAAIDRQYCGNSLVIADLTFDPTYAEPLFDTFGPRVIGVHIGRHGDGMNAELRPVRNRAMPVYTVGRSHLFDLLYSELQSRRVRLANGQDCLRMFQQLNDLEVELRESGKVYKCSAGHHDDLAISCAILVWGARHPHLPNWIRPMQPVRVKPKSIATQMWQACT
jgi:hypothetical protein